MGKDYGPGNRPYTQVMPASGMEYIYDQSGIRYSVPIGRDNLFFYDSQNFSPFDFYKNYGVSGAEPITGDGKDLTQPVNKTGIDAIRESNPYNFKDSGIMTANNVAAFEQAILGGTIEFSEAEMTSLLQTSIFGELLWVQVTPGFSGSWSFPTHSSTWTPISASGTIEQWVEKVV